MRYQNWPELLEQYLNDLAREPFVWGRHDCVHMAARWVRLCSGRDVDLPAYANEREGLRMIRAGGGLSALITARLGPPTDEPQRGDIATIRATEFDGAMVGIVLGEYIAGPGQTGYLLAPRYEMLQAWRV